MSNFQNLLRQLIRENLNEASGDKLTDFEISVINDRVEQKFNVKNKVSGNSGSCPVSKIKIRSSLYTLGLLDIKKIAIPAGGFNPSAPDGQPVLKVDVVIDHPVPLKDDMRKTSALKNKDALLKLANAIIGGYEYEAPPATQEDGSTASLIVNKR